MVSYGDENIFCTGHSAGGGVIVYYVAIASKNAEEKSTNKFVIARSWGLYRATAKGLSSAPTAQTLTISPAAFRM